MQNLLSIAGLAGLLLFSHRPANDQDAGASSPHQGTLKVFVLAGQSNMEGKAKVSLLEHQVQQPATRELFAHFRQGDAWVERDDVWIRFLDRQGPLTVGFGSPGCIGPELQFGWTLGETLEEPVLLIKAAWGGKSLYRDFRPPSAGLPADDVLTAILEREQQRNPERTLDDVKGSFGHFYRELLVQVSDTLSTLGERFPALDGLEPELAGLVWFQGWNDMVNADYTAAYTENMVAFIHDVRRDLEAPQLPIVIGQLGVGGTKTVDEKRQAFKDAQARAADLDAFRGNVAVVRTDRFWDDAAQAVFDKGWRDHLEEWQRVGSDYPYHYLGSVKTHVGMGRAFADSLLALQPPDER